MKTFKSFIQLDEVERAKYKEGIANKLSGVSYLAQTKDPGDLEHVGPEEMGPKGIKTASGKRPADRLDNKQPFGETIEDNLHPAGAALLKHIKPEHHNKYKAHLTKDTFNGSYKDRHAVLKAAHDAGHLKMDLKKQNEEVEELEEAFIRTPGHIKKHLEDLYGRAQTTITGKDNVQHITRHLNDDGEDAYEVRTHELIGKGKDSKVGKLIKHTKPPKEFFEEIEEVSEGDNLALRGLVSTDPKNAGRFLSTQKGKENRAKKNVPELKADIKRQLGRHPKPNLPEQNELDEEDFTPQQTKMAHTIGKEFAKKKVGDTYKGGPYAVASAMVKNKPEAAQKAYNTIKAKMKEEADADLLYKVYNDLNEQNRIVFMNRLEEDADDLLQFAKHMED